MEEIRGNVLRIEKSSIHDGTGLRTVVFLNGCPLSCKWCSTPESQCMHSDPRYGKVMTAEEVVKEVRKDSIFFFHSGGGVTISGGEILYQAEFAREILKGCLQEGIATSCETSLFADYNKVSSLVPYLGSMYVDYKVHDTELHKYYTGVSNEIIRENFRKLDEEYSGDIHIRIPVIPGVNMDEENMTGTAEFFRGFRHVRDIELLPYHRLGMDTYRKLGLEYELPDVETPSAGDMAGMAEAIIKTDPGRRVLIKGETYTGR